MVHVANKGSVFTATFRHRVAIFGNGFEFASFSSDVWVISPSSVDNKDKKLNSIGRAFVAVRKAQTTPSRADAIPLIR